MEYYRRLIEVLEENLLHDCRESSKQNQKGNCGNDVHCRDLHLDRRCYGMIARECRIENENKFDIKSASNVTTSCLEYRIVRNPCEIHQTDCYSPSKADTRMNMNDC